MDSGIVSDRKVLPPRDSLQYAVLGLEEKLGAVEIKQFNKNMFKRKTTTLYDLFDSSDVVKGGWDKAGVPREKLLDVFTDYLPEMSYHCLYTNILVNSIGAYEYVMKHGSPEQREKVEGVGDSLKRRFQENVRGLGHMKSEDFTERAYEKLATKPLSKKAAYMSHLLSDVFEYHGLSERHVFVTDEYTGEKTLEDRGSIEWGSRSWKERLGSCKLTKNPYSSFRRQQTDLYSLMTDWDTTENGWENCGVPVEQLTRALAEYLPEAANYDPNSAYNKAVLRNLVSAREFVKKHGTHVQKEKLKRDAKEIDSGIAYSLGYLFNDEDMLTQGWEVLGIPQDVLCNGLTHYLTQEFHGAENYTYLSNAFSAIDYLDKHGSKKQKGELLDLSKTLFSSYTSCVTKLGYSKKMAEDTADALLYVGWNTDTDNRGLYMMRNLERLAELSRAYGPEVGEHLHTNNNLNWFNRFTCDQLKSAYDNHNNPNVPYILAISVTDDHNGSYTRTPNRNPWGVLDKQLPEGTILRMVEVKSVKEAHAFARLARIQMKKYGAPMLSMIQAHASDDCLAISCKDDERVSQADVRGTSGNTEMTEFMGVLKDIFPPKSIFLIQGCQVGARGGVGQVVSKQMDWTVVAAEESCHFDDLTLHKRGNQLIPELESAKWDVKKQRERQVKTRIYSSGREVSRRRYLKNMDFPNQLSIIRQLEERRLGAPIGRQQQAA